MALGVALLATVVLASTAGAAVPLRTPQVPFVNGALQGYLSANDGGINTLSDQLDAQTFKSNVSGITDFQLMIELSGTAATNVIGVYNAGDANPLLYQLFPGFATAGYSVACRFTAAGVLKVDLFDQLFAHLGQTTYTGVTRDNFGFFIRNGNNTYYSQDSRNGNLPQALTYQGTDVLFGNSSDWWECFNDMPYAPNISTFGSAVLLLQSIAPLPPVSTTTQSWGSLKASYR
jgi:hypothetical protein